MGDLVLALVIPVEDGNFPSQTLHVLFADPDDHGVTYLGELGTSGITTGLQAVGFEDPALANGAGIGHPVAVRVDPRVVFEHAAQIPSPHPSHA